MLSIVNSAALDHLDLAGDEPNLTLAPEEIATLTSLMGNYDSLLLEIDALNGRLEELLNLEGLVLADVSK